MCGIAGIVHREPGSIGEECLRRMCTLMTHRGPDDEGFYFSDRAALGMRRLAIIDVEAGRQPVHNEDRSVWTVFNGEIYNYRELRTDLESRGHRLLTSSDTECLVHLYEEYGDDLVSRLRGMFAFAIWDVRQQKLLLARDRLGIKPLYYWLDGDRMAFASEMKCLLGLETFERKISYKSLSEFFTFAYVPGPSTIYEGVLEVPPAHICVWRDGRIRLRRYWEISPQPEDKPIDFFAEGLLHHLKEAIRLHLASDVPLGAFLSGGIDSSAIVALMSQVSDTQVKTFTVGFAGEEPAFDERPYARAIAHAFGTDHSECLLTADVEDLLPAMIQAFDEPFGDSSVIPNYLICQAARQHVTVALSGLGGDELFAGYERYRGALLAEEYRRLPRHLRRQCVEPLIEAFPASRNGGVWTDRVRRFLRGADFDLADRYQRYISAFNDSDKTELFSGDVVRELEQRGLARTALAMRHTGNGWHPLDQMLFTDIHTYLPDDELRKADRMSMWNSLEVRVPFLDHQLVEFVATIPAKYKLRRWQKKHILLRALRGVLPASILSRRKRGFSVPLSAWLRGPLRELVHTCLAESALRRLGLFDARTVTRILMEHERGLANHELKIWTLLTFVLWHDLYIANQRPRVGSHLYAPRLTAAVR
jgi:asparagine synthase (glutamine-hydrolysing)